MVLLSHHHINELVALPIELLYPHTIADFVSAGEIPFPIPHIIDPDTCNFEVGVLVPIPIFPPVLNIFVLVVVREPQFRKGVAHNTHACKNPVAPVAQAFPWIP